MLSQTQNKKTKSFHTLFARSNKNGEKRLSIVAAGGAQARRWDTPDKVHARSPLQSPIQWSKNTPVTQSLKTENRLYTLP